MHLILYSSGAQNAGFHVLYIHTNSKQTDKQKIQRLLSRIIFLLKTYICVSFLKGEPFYLMLCRLKHVYVKPLIYHQMR